MSTADHCLDPALALPALQAVMPGARGVRVLASRRNASRRRNPHPLTLRYEIDLPEGPRAFYGKVFREGASAAAHPGAPVLHVPALDLLLWPWPADPALTQMPTLLDPAQTLPFWGEPAARAEALRYEPEVRATLRYTHADGRTLYAKTFADARGAAIHRRFVHFWQRAHDPRVPRVAQPLGYTPATRTLWQAAADGRPLLQFVPEGCAAVAGATALAWATLHDAPLDLAGTPARDRVHWLAEVHRRQQKIARAAPALASRVAQVADAIVRAAARFDEPPLALIHGDCHPDQLWWHDGRIVAFDFDEFCPGDPMEDLASFVVRLGTVPGGSRFATLMLAAYAGLAPQHFNARSLRWHLAVQQLLQASRAFVFQQPGWHDELERRLARTEALALQDTLEILP